MKALRGVPDFAGLDDRALLQIVGASVNLAYADGSVVFRAGDPSEALYVVLSGGIRIVEGDGKGSEVAALGPGGSFGELSLLLNRTHSRSARAVQESELLVIPRESFEEVLATNPELAAMFRRRVEERHGLESEVEGQV